MLSPEKVWAAALLSEAAWMRNDMISVIIPVYNVEKYLDRCMRSVLDQTYGDLEVLLVDDGSTDSSGQMCDAYQNMDARVHSFHKQNGGLSDARNYGIDRAVGEFLFFVDSDDWIHTRTLEILHDKIAEHHADIAVCEYREVSEEEVILDAPVGDVPCAVYREREVFRPLFEKNTKTVVAWNKLYRREVFGDVRYPKGKLHEDEYVIHELLYRAGSLVWCEVPLYYYLKRNSSITGNMKKQNILDGWGALQSRQNFLKEKGLPREAQETQIIMLSYVMSKYRLVRNGMGDRETAKWLLQEFRRMEREPEMRERLKSIGHYESKHRFALSPSLFFMEKSCRQTLKEVKRKLKNG